MPIDPRYWLMQNAVTPNLGRGGGGITPYDRPGGQINLLDPRTWGTSPGVSPLATPWDIPGIRPEETPPFYTISPPQARLIGDWERPGIPRGPMPIPNSSASGGAIPNLPPSDYQPGLLPNRPLPLTLESGPPLETIASRPRPTPTPTPAPYESPEIRSPAGRLTSGAMVNLADMPPDYMIQEDYSAYRPDLYDYGGSANPNYNYDFSDPGGGVQPAAPPPYQYDPNAYGLLSTGPAFLQFPTTAAAGGGPQVILQSDDTGNVPGGGYWPGGSGATTAGGVNPWGMGFYGLPGEDIPTAPGVTPDVAPATAAAPPSSDIDISGIPGMYGLNLPDRTFLGDLGLDIKDIVNAIGKVPGAIGNLLRQPGYSSPDYLASIGYREGAGSGSMWPGGTATTGPGDIGSYGVSGGQFYGTMPGAGSLPGSFTGLGQGSMGNLGTFWDRIVMRNYLAGRDPTMGFGNVNPMTQFASFMRGGPPVASYATVAPFYRPNTAFEDVNMAAVRAAPRGAAREATRGIGGPGGRAMAAT